VTTASRRAATVLGARQGHVLGHTRAGVWVLFVLAAANGLFLYLMPGWADTEYAWPIEPPVSAASIGAGFLVGTLATGLVLWSDAPARVLAAAAGALGLATTLLAIGYATLAAWCVLLLALPRLFAPVEARTLEWLRE
jgi:hypothetical protein